MSKQLTTEEFIDKARLVHGDKYDYTNTVYSGAGKKVSIVCPIHGQFEQEANAHCNKKQGCPKCGIEQAQDTKESRYNTEWFVTQAREVHGDKYGYLNTVYKGTSEKVTIKCEIHGEFEQRAQSHLQGCGCKECANANNNYWSYSGWEKAGKESMYFDGYKVYVLKIYNETEVFYKIGKTYNPVWLRFSRGQLPYDYKVLKTIEGSADYICKLEQELLNKHNEYKYTPSITFAGSGECFSRIIEEELK